MVEKGKNYKKAAEIMKKGGVIAYATDTVYGLGCLLSKKTAIERIYLIKGRDRDKPFLVNVATKSMLSGYIVQNKTTEKLFSQFWPGKLTVICAAGEKMPEYLLNGRSTVGVRIPDCDIALSMMKLLDEPVISTSVNRAGMPAMLSSDEIEKEFFNEIDYILEDDGSCSGKASTIVMIEDSGLKVIRSGTLVKTIEKKGFQLLF